LGGAHQDNRIVPYEGLPGSALSALQRRNLLDLISAYVAPLPPGPQKARMEEIERHLGKTHFCWIGGHSEDSAFYYRIQSPVVFIEFDHHAGVFLTNAEPAKFHVHTIVRTPNGNDYGVDLLRQHYREAEHHRGAPNETPGHGAAGHGIAGHGIAGHGMAGHGIAGHGTANDGHRSGLAGHEAHSHGSPPGRHSHE
jgi:hypothetical protein